MTFADIFAADQHCTEPGIEALGAWTVAAFTFYGVAILNCMKGQNRDFHFDLYASDDCRPAHHLAPCSHIFSCVLDFRKTCAGGQKQFCTSLQLNASKLKKEISFFAKCVTQYVSDE